MAQVNFSLVPIGGDVDKYKVILYNGLGNSVLQQKEFTPAFANPTTDSFTGLIRGTTYKVGVVVYVGLLSKTCALKTIVAGSGDTV